MNEEKKYLFQLQYEIKNDKILEICSTGLLSIAYKAQPKKVLKKNIIT